jgi:hypothetical protein
MRTEPLRVLAAGQGDGRRLEVVQQTDGTLAIVIDGRSDHGYRWPAEKLEDCVNAYLALLRVRPVITEVSGSHV